MNWTGKGSAWIRGRWVVIASTSVLVACGGGREDGATVQADSAATDSAAVQAVEVSAEQRNVLEAAAQASWGTLAAAQVQQLQTAMSTDAIAQDGVPTMTAQATLMAPTRRLAPDGLLPASTSLLADVRGTGRCQATYVAPAALKASAPVPLAAPITMSASDLTSFAAQIASGPFLRSNDYKSGSPDEMRRLQANVASFISQGEAVLTAVSAESLRPTHGSLARDAAFVHMVQPSAPLLAALREYLVTQALAPLNEFASQLCLRQLDGSVRDAWFGEASWLARFVVSYDAVRSGLSSADRLLIENFIRRNAYFLAAQVDYGLNYVFPARLSGNYVLRASAAAASSDAERYLSARSDTNGDCRIDAADDARAFPVYAYTKGDGSTGPRLSVLSQWYNNRKSLNAFAFGAAGVLLGDAELTGRAKRYFTEWLTYSVYPDGSEGEYSRNGDYCVANQGVVYAASNLQGAALLADMLARKGDRQLLDLSTRDGLFGTEVSGTQPTKTLNTVIATHLDLARGVRPWFFRTSALTKQSAVSSNQLGRMDAQIFGSGGYTDSYHQLGLLLAAKNFPSQPIAGFVLRDPSVTSLRWPGSTGNAVATGFGSWVGAWTDAFNVYPSALVIRGR